jgi:putrescine transport system permease protein
MSTLEPRPGRKPGGFALWLARMQMAHGRKLVIALPYVWLILLFLLPFLIVFKISLAEMARAIPPYTDLMDGRTAS